MIKINLLNDIKNAPHHEKNEKEHKELVETANRGIGAVRELKKHYGEQTNIISPWGKDRLSEIDMDDVEEMEFEVTDE